MKKRFNQVLAGILIFLGVISPIMSSGQSPKGLIKKYMTKLPSGKPENNGTLQKYRMTAIYTNMDTYGNFTDKTKVTGDYTSGYEGGYSQWNNVQVANAKKESDPFPTGKKQEFMENFRYKPSSGMMNVADFKSFPMEIDNIFARNLIWDMLGLEIFAWGYNDSLRLTVPYTVPDIKGYFNMAEIGRYNHSSVQLCWTGVSAMNSELCAVIEYRALNNKVEVATGNIKTKGTEQYWGNTWISLRTKQIEFGEIFSATFQEIEIGGMKNKLLIKTIRELKVERIK